MEVLNQGELLLSVMSKLSFSLNKSKPAAPAAPSFKQPAAFAAFDDDEPTDAAPTASSSRADVSANKKLLAQNVVTSKKLKKQMEQEKKVDATVYEYDEVWDKMQQAKLQAKEAKEAESKDKNVCICIITIEIILTIGFSPNTFTDCSVQLLHENWIICAQKKR